MINPSHVLASAFLTSYNDFLSIAVVYHSKWSSVKVQFSQRSECGTVGP